MTIGHSRLTLERFVPEQFRFPVLEARTESESAFVDFWSSVYSYPSLDDQHPLRPLTADMVRSLFKWKNGSVLSAAKQASVERNFVARLDEINRMTIDTPASEFLARFASGGAIWRIFMLHCWQPTRFPIYDQHVHRAMCHILGQEVQELTSFRDDGKVGNYVSRYMPFFARFADPDRSRIDRALWQFGKTMKNKLFRSFLSAAESSLS